MKIRSILFVECISQAARTKGIWKDIIVKIQQRVNANAEEIKDTTIEKSLKVSLFKHDRMGRQTNSLPKKQL